MRKLSIRSYATANHRYGDCAEAEEERSLQNVHPDSPAHAAEKHSESHHHGHDGTPKRIGDERATSADSGGNVSQNRSAAHNADDHVRHEHCRTQCEDDRADRVTFPPVAIGTIIFALSAAM